MKKLYHPLKLIRYDDAETDDDDDVSGNTRVITLSLTKKCFVASFCFSLQTKKLWPMN
jgi:hypothetical protein